MKINREGSDHFSVSFSDLEYGDTFTLAGHQLAYPIYMKVHVQSCQNVGYVNLATGKVFDNRPPEGEIVPMDTEVQIFGPKTGHTVHEKSGSSPVEYLDDRDGLPVDGRSYVYEPHESSVINCLRYDRSERVAVVQFQNNLHNYKYKMPIDVFQAWVNHNSPGRFYNHHIKGHCERVDK